MNTFISYYNPFYKIVKNNFPNYASQLIRPHEMMKELQKTFGI